MTWQERIKPLYDRFHELNGYVAWEGFISLDPDRPTKKDLLIQHWVLFKDDEDFQKVVYYLVRVDLNDGGFEVYKPVTESPMIQDCIDVI